MNPSELIVAAEILLASNRRRPTATSLKRAISSIYYALFHSLARDCADLLIGTSGADRSEAAWRQVYRSLDHGFVKTQCGKKDMLRKFPRPIVDFGDLFVSMQRQRHQADYDPFSRFRKTDVVNAIWAAKEVITEYRAVTAKHRRAFAAYVMFKQRSD